MRKVFLPNMTRDEQRELIYNLHVTQGLTYEQIGQQLGKTRCAIAGFCHRVNIKLTKEQWMQAHARGQQTRYKDVVKPMSKPVTPKTAKPDKEPYDPIIKLNRVVKPSTSQPELWMPINGAPPLHLQELRNQYHECRWPLGEHTHTVCGLPTRVGSPYCETHTGMAFNPLKEKGKVPVHVRSLVPTKGVSWHRATSR